MDTRPNVILIMTDQMRGDCLSFRKLSGISGNPDVKTPWLDSIAQSGILYENAYSACPSCIAARAALHTGMSQERNGRVGYKDGIEWNYEHTMAGEMAKAGYNTYCVGKMHVHPLRSLLGYNNVELHDGYLHYYRKADRPVYEDQRLADDYFYWLKNQKGIAADVTDTGIDCNSWLARPWNYDESLHPTKWVTDRSMDFLRKRDRRKPFFLTVSYLRPHPPYDAPQAFFDMYKDKELSEVPVGDWADTELYKTAGRDSISRTAPADSELLRQARVGYYACITHLDFEIGRLYMALIEEGLLENTVIIFTSDHGEMLGDHNFCRKSLPYEGSAHVPMMIAGPQHLVKERGISDKLVELRDVMPTVLEAAGVPVPDSVDGISMLREDAKHEWIHGEHTYDVLSNHFIVTNVDKYIWFTETGEEQYFDLKNDPKELQNRIADPACQERIAVLRSHLVDILKNRKEGFSDGEKLIAGCPVTPFFETPYTNL